MNLFSFLTKKTVRAVNQLPLQLTNTLLGAKQAFVTLRKREVLMYNCGPTVYDFVHIGNLRAYVTADLLRRALSYNGYRVSQVINITDVGHLSSDADEGEDKMSSGLKREGKELTLANMRELGEHYTQLFLKDIEQLNLPVAAITFPRASDYIDEQIALAQTLEEKGYAYRTDEGLYYDISRFPEYGKLGSIDVTRLQAGDRIGTTTTKRNPADFALWKIDPNLGWDSPWGKGFPGWHLECTAMIFAELGKQIDIHTGGIDHIPVHHNNEIAQAEAITHKTYANYWLHGAFVTIDGQKISKSLGNTVRLEQLLDRGFLPLAYRYWLLTAHYRSPINFTWEALDGAQTAYKRLLKTFVEELGNTSGTLLPTYVGRFHARINDDLDTPQIIAMIWELLRDQSVSRPDKKATLIHFDAVLGLGLIEGNERIKSMLQGTAKRVAVTETSDDVQKLVASRETARKNKDWKKADELRDAIEEAGYHVIDSDKGSELEKK